MKRKHIFWIGLVAVLIAVATVYGAMTNSADQITNYSNYITSQNRYLNPLYKFANEVEGYAEGTTAWPATLANVEVFDANDTLTAAETGKVCAVYGYSKAANCILTLPAASAGLQFTIIDANSTANADTYIKAGTGDKINDGTAAQYLACKTDSAGQSVTLVAMDDERWMIVAVSGTWVADDSPD